MIISGKLPASDHRMAVFSRGIFGRGVGVCPFHYVLSDVDCFKLLSTLRFRMLPTNSILMLLQPDEKWSQTQWSPRLTSRLGSIKSEY